MKINLRKFAPVLIFSVPAIVFYSCKTTTNYTEPKAQPPDRKLLGVAQPYLPQKTVTINQQLTSLKARREKAWEIVHSLIKPVTLTSEYAEKIGIRNPTLPLWQTFYESEEILWMFEDLYENLNGEKVDLSDNSKRIPDSNDFCPEDLKEIFEIQAKQELSFRFPKERFMSRLGQLRNKEQVRGISGTGTTLFSPAVALHYFMNYRQVFGCDTKFREGLAAEDSPPSSENHTQCFSSEFPTGSKKIFADWSPNLSPRCTMTKDSLENWAATLVGGAVAIKTSWQQVTPKSEVAVFDTSSSGMQKTLESGEWTPTKYIKSESIPNDDIYTIELIANDDKSTSKFQLTGIHFVTKDTKDWSWISLWWSPDADKDFGADRPKGERTRSFDSLGAWKNYKMCTTVHYNELSGSPSSEMTDSSLADAINTTHAFTTPHTWCSNPYIEMGLGNARTNCIGCHQHAGMDINPDDTFSFHKATNDKELDERNAAKDARNNKLYPHGGRSRVRANFPGEYLWSFSDGPDFIQSEMSQTITSY